MNEKLCDVLWVGGGLGGVLWVGGGLGGVLWVRKFFVEKGKSELNSLFGGFKLGGSRFMRYHEVFEGFNEVKWKGWEWISKMAADYKKEPGFL